MEGDPNPNLPPIGGNDVANQSPDYLKETAGVGSHEEMKEEQEESSLVVEEEDQAGNKPPGKLLIKIKEKNQQALLQDYSLLVPGIRIYTKWFGRFRKKFVKAPYNTPWTQIVLVSECLVSQGTRKVWNFGSPYCAEIKGHVTLMPGEAWEIMANVTTREEIKDRDDRNLQEGHKLNKLPASLMETELLEEDPSQPTTSKSATPQLDPYLTSHSELFESIPFKDNSDFGQNPNMQVLNVSARTANFMPQLDTTIPSPYMAPPGISSRPPSTTGSMNTTRLEEFMDRLERELRERVFNYALKDTPIVTKEIKDLLLYERLCCRIVNNVEIAISAERSSNPIQPIDL